jgi:hypothetical protein
MPFRFFLAFLVVFFIHVDLAAAGYDDRMKFTYQYTGGNCMDCAWVLAEGVIGPETDKEFANFLKGQDISSTLEFNSPGGDLQAAIRLGQLIRDAGWDTHVGYHYIAGTSHDQMLPLGSSPREDSNLKQSKCMSACAYAFLGGVARDIQEGAELGVHQFSDPSNSSSAAQLLQGALAQYVQAMGANPAFVYIAAASTSPGNPKLYVASRSEMEDWNVVTNYRRDTGWTIVTKQSGVVAQAHGTGKMKSSLAIFCKADGSPYLDYNWMPRLGSVYKGKARELGNALSDSGTFIVNVENSKEIAQQKVPKGGIRVASDIQFSLTLPLEQKAVEKIRTAKGISVELDTPHVFYGWAPRDSFKMKSARENIDIALKNCVRG